MSKGHELRNRVNGVFGLSDNLVVHPQCQHNSLKHLVSGYNYNQIKKHHSKNAMECIVMNNPASKIRSRRFLKRGTSYYEVTFSKKKSNPAGSASSIKNKSVDSLQPTRNVLLPKKMINVGVMTQQTADDKAETIKKLTQEKEELSKKLETKRSQMIELNLKYLSLKEKVDLVEINGQKMSENISHLSEFGDISNISEMNNTSISKKSKAEELAAIKARLQRLNLRKLTEKLENQPVLPSIL